MIRTLFFGALGILGALLSRRRPVRTLYQQTVRARCGAVVAVATGTDPARVMADAAAMYGAVLQREGRELLEAAKKERAS